MMGNPEAVASAYSLHDYVNAADLGGPDALADLKQRAWQRTAWPATWRPTTWPSIRAG
ncbi:MAG: hypothetical protein KIS63_06495 [Caldilineales bacterium]|nr:hypothetical protein [Caldilineales bacterium]